MKRLPDWPTRLVTTIDKASQQKFEWGTHDCCLFGCACIKAVTGHDPAAKYRGTYSTRHGAARVLNSLGDSLEDVVMKIAADLKLEPIDWRKANRGDVALVATVFGDALAVHYGGEIFVPGADGLERLPATHARLHWAL